MSNRDAEKSGTEKARNNGFLTMRRKDEGIKLNNIIR